MNRFLKYHFFGCIIICFVFWTNVRAEQPDTRLRSQIGISYKPLKTLDVTASYRLDINENLSTFQRSNFELGVGYSVLKWLEIETSYRFMTGYNKDSHRFKAGVSAKKNTSNKKFQFQWKSLLNFNSNYLDRDYWKMEDPSWVWRNKFKTKYNISKKLSVSVYVEQFLKLKDSESYFYRDRFGTSLDYELKKRHSFSIGYYYQLEYNRKSPENNNTFEIEYNFELKKKKKPKLKLDSAEYSLFY